MPPIVEWHALSAADAFARLGSAPDGLQPAEAARRLAAHGPNALEERRRVTALSLLAAQFRNALVVVLLVAVALSALLGHTVEAITIVVIVLLAVLLGFVQEYRAEHVLATLRRLAAPTATVVRAGSEVELPAREVVPGDVVLLHAGDKVPWQFVNAYVFRSERHTVLHHPFANRWLNAAIAWELALLAAVVYLPALRRPFGTFALPIEDWIVVGLAAVSMAPVVESAKAYARRARPHALAGPSG